MLLKHAGLYMVKNSDLLSTQKRQSGLLLLLRSEKRFQTTSSKNVNLKSVKLKKVKLKNVNLKNINLKMNPLESNSNYQTVSI